jgi:GMP synthase (glutamine-hydrolysing)
VKKSAVLVVEHEATAGAGLMAGALGTDVHTVRPYRGEPLPDLARFGGLVVLGGSMGAGDDEIAPWLPATRYLIRDAVRTELPTLGICLGAQLLAAATGGTVERGREGLELGVVPVTPLPAVSDDPFFGGVLQALAADRSGAAAGTGRATAWLVRQYHYDAVVRLPADAELMVTGQRYPYQGFRVGPAAWGVQYHPEVSTGLFTRWVEGSVQRGELPADAVDVLGPVRAEAATQARLAAVHASVFLDAVSGATAVARTTLMT